MPKRRPQIEEGLRAPDVRPSFPRFNDSYIPGAAARGARSDLEQLARGLSEFNRNVTPLLAGIVEDRNRKDVDEGKRLQQEGEPLPEDANKFQRAGYEREAGYAYAAEIRDRTLAELAARRHEGEQVSVEDFHQTWDAFAEEVGADLPDDLLTSDEFRIAAADASTVYRRGESQNVARQQTERAETELIEMTGNNTARFVATSLPEMEDAEILTEVQARVELAIQEDGLSPRSATRAVIGSMLDLAEQNSDLSGLSIEDRKRLVKLAGEVKLKEGPAKFSKRYSDQLDDAYGQVLSDEEDNLRVGNASSAARIREGYAAARDTYNELTDSNPNAFISERQWDDMEAEAKSIGGPLAVERVRDLRAVHGKGYDDPQVTGGIYHRYMSGETDTAQAVEEIDAAMRAGRITPQTAAEMTSDLNEFGPHGIKGSDIPAHERELYKLHVGRDLEDTFGDLNPQLVDQFHRARSVMRNWLRTGDTWEVYRTAPAHVKRQLELAAYRYAVANVPTLRGE